MPKQAEALNSWDLPEALPAGVNVGKMSRTVGTRPARNEGESDEDFAARCDADPTYIKNATVQVLRVEPTGEGVKNAIALLSEIGPGDDFGIQAAAVALDNFFAGIVTRLDADNYQSATGFVPPLSGPRYIDDSQVMTQAIANFFQSNGRPPSAEEYATMMAELSS